VQLTPPGSECSIQIGTGLTRATPGTYQGMYLITKDIEATRAELLKRGVEVSEPFHRAEAGCNYPDSNNGNRNKKRRQFRVLSSSSSQN